MECCENRSDQYFQAGALPSNVPSNISLEDFEQERVGLDCHRNWCSVRYIEPGEVTLTNRCITIQQCGQIHLSSSLNLEERRRVFAANQAVLDRAYQFVKC